MLPFLIIPFRGSQHGEERQRPDTAGPRDRHQQRQDDPAQPARLGKILLTRARGVPVDPEQILRPLAFPDIFLSLTNAHVGSLHQRP